MGVPQSLKKVLVPLEDESQGGKAKEGKSRTLAQ